ncbi:MAG: carbohydrate kinase family protein [Lachnospiraceae bacterium]|jgi:fructokinase
MGYDVVTFGDILIDFTDFGDRDGITLFARNPGGANANVAAATARLGGRTAFIGKVGTDLLGTYLKEVMEKYNVDVSGLVMDGNYFTTMSFVKLAPDGERVFSFARKLGADTQIRKEELNGDILDNTKIFATGSLALTDEPARSTCFAAVQEAKDHGSIIAYDPNYRASLWPDEKTAVQHMRSMIPYVDIMKISDEETLLMTDHQDPAEAAKVLFDEGVKVVAVTLDKEGAYVCTKEGGAAVPAFKANAVDATGAGDSFWGSFLLQVAQSGKKPEDISLDDAISFARFANAAASISVENYGGIPSMPTLDMVEKRLNG